MKARELMKALTEKGLTPEQVLKLVERYEQQKERVKKYQKETYLKVSVSVRKEEVEKIKELTGLSEDSIKRYLAGIKLLQKLSRQEMENLEEAIKVLKTS